MCIRDRSVAHASSAIVSGTIGASSRERTNRGARTTRARESQSGSTRPDALQSDRNPVLDSSTRRVLCYANPMAFKFCPECGLRTEPGARFCASCGQVLRAAGAAWPLAGIVTLAALVLLGGGFWLYQRYGPEPARALKPGERVAAANPGAGPAN